MTAYDIGAPPLHIISGMPFEARALRRALPPRSFHLSFSGANAARARELAFAAAASGPAGLVSFGLAGGLDPALVPGTLLVPAMLVDARNNRYGVTPLWRAALQFAARSNGIEIVEAPLAGVDAVAASPRDKERLFAERGACAVDIESLFVAEAAAHYDLPFVVLRAVADPASRAIPAAAQAAVAGGRIRLMPIVRGIAAQPSLAGELFGLARDTRAAQRALALASHGLLPALLMLLRPR